MTITIEKNIINFKEYVRSVHQWPTNCHTVNFELTGWVQIPNLHPLSNFKIYMTYHSPLQL